MKPAVTMEASATNGQFVDQNFSDNHSTQTNYDRPCTRESHLKPHFVQTWLHKGQSTIGNHVLTFFVLSTVGPIGLTHWEKILSPVKA